MYSARKLNTKSGYLGGMSHPSTWTKRNVTNVYVCLYTYTHLEAWAAIKYSSLSGSNAEREPSFAPDGSDRCLFGACKRILINGKTIASLQAE